MLRDRAAQYARQYGVNPDLFARVIQQESAWNPRAKSPAGAYGLTQIMPATARSPGFGVQPVRNIEDTDEQLRFGAEYLSAMLSRYGGDQNRALAAYNWGAGNADRWDGNIASLPQETRGYLANITGGQDMRQPTRVSTRGTPPSFPQSGGEPAVSRGQEIAQAAALAFNQLRSDPDRNLARQFQSQNQQARQSQAKNRTVEWLRSQGREDLAGAVEAGTIGARDAFVMTQQRADPVKGVNINGKLVNPVTGDVIGDFSEAERQTPPGTKVINGRLVNENTGEVIGDYRDAPEGYEQITGSELGLTGEMADRLFNRAPDGKITQVGGSGQTINVGQGEGAFDKETGKILAQEAAEVVAQGAQAQRSLGQLNTLEQALSNAPSGAGGALINAAANLGIKTEGSSDVEVANAIISQLVPQQRPPGSGVMSDADIEMFRQSLPRLINTREGNQRIIETMRGIANYDMRRGQIARRLQLGEITPQQAADAYRKLGNPLSGFRERAQSGDGGGNEADLTPEERQFLGLE